MKRILVLLSATAMMVAMMAMSGVALAQGADVCVSNKGDTKVQKGTSTCSTDPVPQSRAVAVNGSTATAPGGGSTALAINDSEAGAGNGGDSKAINDSTAGTSFGTATAINDSTATASGDCTATAQNGENVNCP